MYKKKLKNIVWFASTIEGMENLINNTELTMADIKVLMYFLSIIDTNNIIEIPTQKEIGVKLKISRKKVSESVNKLKKHNLIVKVKGIRTYFINPHYFYTGFGQDLNDKLEFFKTINESKEEIDAEYSLQNDLNYYIDHN